MLSKKHRIRRKEFKEFLHTREIHHSPLLTFRIINRPEKGHASMFGFSVSKKNFKNATDRNTIRRRGYAALQRFLPRIHTPVRGVFSVKNSSKKPSFEDLSANISELLKKAKAL